MASINRDEALQIARAIAAGACAMHGCADDYCQMMREGRFDNETEVQSALAALMLSDTHLQARLKEIRERSTNVVGLAA